MTVKISGDEQEQILQTIDMFEVIAKSNPDDYQSLALLRDAYAKLGRQRDVLRVRRQLGAAFSRMGQYAAARKELENVLADNPDDAEAAALLESVNASLESQEDDAAQLAPEHEQPISLDFSAFDGDSNPSLIRTDRTLEGDESNVHLPSADLPDDDGNDALANFLVQHELFRQDAVDDALARVRSANADFQPDRVAAPLLTEVLRQSTMEDEELVFTTILEQTKLGFVPLENYDIDRQILKMLPEEITLGRLIVPFDLISRTMMLATCNPFDAPGRAYVQSTMDYTIQWYFATPQAITSVLANAYRLETPRK